MKPIVVTTLFLMITSSSYAIVETGKKDIVVMVIDTGIAPHKDLRPWVQYNSSQDYIDRVGHGTHVTGIIAFGDGEDPTPLCKNVKIVSCNANVKDRYLELTLDCIEKAIKMKADYINNSSSGRFYSQAELDFYKSFSDQGGVTVVSAGNEGYNLAVIPKYPANYGFGKDKVPNFFTVSNVDRDGRLHESSNHHPEAFRELGDRVLSTVPNDKYDYKTGTSMSAPMFLHKILKRKCQELQ